MPNAAMTAPVAAFVYPLLPLGRCEARGPADNGLRSTAGSITRFDLSQQKHCYLNRRHHKLKKAWCICT
jgi:hypothetical protein